MSTALSNPKPGTELLRALAVLALLLACLAPWPAAARQGDRNQTIHVDADHAIKHGDQATLTGHVSITQGSLEIKAAKGTAYSNDSGNTERIVVEGNPARLQQRMDDGSLMRAHANTIIYLITVEKISLEGNAHVQRPGQGSFDGAHLVYTPATGAIEGDGGQDGRVHLTLEPSHANDN